MKNYHLSPVLLGIGIILLSSLVCRAQSTDVGTAAQMPDSNGAKIALQVSADNTYSWKLDGEDQGQITAAAGTKQVMTPAGKHEIVARSPDGKTRFDRIFTVGSGKANAIRIIGKAAAPSASPSTAATKAPSPAPASPVTPTPRQLPQQLPQQQPPPVRERPQFPTAPATQPGSLGNPDMFVRIQLYASKGSAKTRPYSPAGASPASSDWQVMVSVVPIRGTYYDVKLQVVMKDVGDGGTSVELADSQPGPVRNLYMTRAEALGKEAVVCYTARAASQQAQRWTGTFNLQSGYQGRVTFEPAHEPALEPASDAPCGGLTVTKAAPLPPAVEGPTPHEKAVNSMNARLALSQGSRLYNARRYPEARPL